jgi:hypothetical protein
VLVPRSPLLGSATYCYAPRGQSQPSSFREYCSQVALLALDHFSDWLMGVFVVAWGHARILPDALDIPTQVLLASPASYTAVIPPKAAL